MSVRRSRLLWFGVLALLPCTAATAADALERFLAGLTSWRAPFTQEVIDSAGKSVERGSGTLLVGRPGRFRWEYTPRDGGAQLLIADGRNLWFYDQELQQATVKPASSALAATPVVLLSGTDAEMRAAFEIVPQAVRDGLAWVKVTPRSATADFASAELGFRDTQLQRLRIHDRLGQTVTLSFTRSVRNAPLLDSELQFTPPAGVDVIGTAAAP